THTRAPLRLTELITKTCALADLARQALANKLEIVGKIHFTLRGLLEENSKFTKCRGHLRKTGSWARTILGVWIIGRHFLILSSAHPCPGAQWPRTCRAMPLHPCAAPSRTGVQQSSDDAARHAGATKRSICNSHAKEHYPAPESHLRASVTARFYAAPPATAYSAYPAWPA